MLALLLSSRVETGPTKPNDNNIAHRSRPLGSDKMPLGRNRTKSWGMAMSGCPSPPLPMITPSLGQEWVALAERELFFQHAGVAVARGNSAILDTLRHTWSKGSTNRRQAKDPNKPSDDFLGGRFWHDTVSAAEITQVVRSGGF